MADNNQDINQLLKVRREKLAELQEQGNDPFTITKYDVTAHTQQIKDNYEQFEGKDVDYASGGREPPKSFYEYQECQQDPCDTLQLQ